MTRESVGRRLLSALADSTPAFTPAETDEKHGRIGRVVSALGDTTRAFRAGSNLDEYTSRPHHTAGRFSTTTSANTELDEVDPFGTRQSHPHRSQQPYLVSYGQPVAWGSGDLPPQPPSKPKAPLVVGASLATLLVVGSVAAAVALTSDTTPSPSPATSTWQSTQPDTTRPSITATGDDFEVGRCATLTPEENNRATIQLTECGGVLSDVVIAKVQAGECADPYLSFDPGKGEVYCLAMDAKEGDCFKLDQFIKRDIACVGVRTRKVVKIVDGVADGKQCAALPETIKVYVYPDPPKALCLGKAADQ